MWLIFSPGFIPSGICQAVLVYGKVDYEFLVGTRRTSFLNILAAAVFFFLLRTNDLLKNALRLFPVQPWCVDQKYFIRKGQPSPFSQFPFLFLRYQLGGLFLAVGTAVKWRCSRFSVFLCFWSNKCVWYVVLCASRSVGSVVN